MSSDKMLTRIGALLRQAESTDNEHEAEAFMEAAQRLATASSIDLTMARSHTSSKEKRATPIQRVIRIGEAGKKGLRTYAGLFLAIAHANDVQCDITTTSTQIFAYGFSSDIDTCEMLYSSLLVQMVRASDRYIKSGDYRSATAQTVVTRGSKRYLQGQKPLSGITARLEFQTAFGSRIGKRLSAVKKEAETAAIEAAPDTGTAIVLRDKQIELRDYYTESSQARGTWRGNRGQKSWSSAARRAGDRAGQQARIGSLPEIGGARGQLE